MMACRTAVLALAVVLASVPAASAQQAQRGTFPQRGSAEVGGGGVWTRGFDLAPRTAQLSRSTPGEPFNLFSTDSELQRSTGGYARLGVYLTRAVSVEAGVRYAVPTLTIRLSGDAESAPDEEATASVSQYIFEGALLWHLNGASFAGGRGVPFVSAGGGHLRELHEGNELVETGRQFHVSAGIKYWSGRGRRSAGLRAEVGVSSREGGVAGDEPRQSILFGMAGVTLLF